jgi:hypothetical protein
MRTYLAVDKLEPPPRIGNLLAQVGGKLGQQVAMFPSSSLRIAMQLGNVAGHQRAPLRIKRSDIALGMPYLSRDAQKLSSRAFTSNGSIDLTVIIQQPLQRLSIPTAVSLIGASH